MTTENQLLPCPFCGSEPTDHAIEPHSHSFTLDGFKMPDHKGSHVIECKCGAGFVADTLNAATALWNARAALTQPAQPAEGGEAVKASWWMRETEDGFEWTDTAPLVRQGWTPLYTAPPASHVPEADFGNTPPASQEQAQQPSGETFDQWLKRERPAGCVSDMERGWKACVASQQPSGGEVVAWRTFDGEGGYEYRDFEGNENYAVEWTKRNPRHKGWVEALTLATPKPEPMTSDPVAEVPNAMKIVTAALLSDPEYAWAWHCNIAMAAHDEGVGHYAANKAAARFLSILAPGLDTSKHLGFPSKPEITESPEPMTWQPIETAPDNTGGIVVVRWLDGEGNEQHDLDYTEDGTWSHWHDRAEHVEIIGGHGVSYTPPYQHWMPLPPAPITKGEA